MPYLTLSSQEFDSLPQFSKFVTKLLRRRNDQVDVYLMKLSFHGAGSQVFVKRIAGYAFSHNVQDIIVSSTPVNQHGLPLCLIRGSLSLKHFTFTSIGPDAYLNTPKTPWDFPVLTTLHLSNVTLRGGKDTGDSIDLFSKCFNLKILTLKSFCVFYRAVFDIITPRLENLMLVNCSYANNVVNVIAPQLENLTLPKYSFHSLNKASIALNPLDMPYNEQDAHHAINMLQKLHSARFLTLNLGIVECLSSLSDLVLQYPSPFSNLVCLNIDYSRAEADKVKLSIATRDFLLANSPDATLIEDLPEEPSIKDMLEKVATKKKAKLIADDVKCDMMELQVSEKKLLEHMMGFQASAKEQEIVLFTKACIWELMALLPKALGLEKKMHTDHSNKRAQIAAELAQLTGSIRACVGKLHDLYEQEYENFEAIHSKEKRATLMLLKNFPTQDTTHKIRRLKVTQKQHRHLVSTVQDLSLCNKKIIDVYKEHVSHNYISTFQDIARAAEDWANRFEFLQIFIKVDRAMAFSKYLKSG
uniref:uncharacterized protein LOC122610948 n=1 Tax=Erigeron canadensis TaxID=72917 RepID=UPI001CB88BA2|nr:uncharacterized protein LOC122610948 [Erigeron canadensis]